MSLNSVNTNIGAQVALASLNSTNTQLQASQKRISTGFRVADATDDGGAFAVAQRVRSDTGVLASVNQQLGGAKGLVSIAVTSLKGLSDTINQAGELLAKIGNASNTQITRDQDVISYKKLVVQAANYVDGATYGGQSLLGSVNNSVAGTSKTIINSETGSTSTLSGADNSGIAQTLAGLIGATFNRTTAGGDVWTATAGSEQAAASAALTSTTGATSYASALTNIANQSNQTGADSNLLDSTISFNSSKIDSLNAGLGALIDTDLSKESANLQALQIKQQLGTQELSLANQAPQSLLSLFK